MKKLLSLMVFGFALLFIVGAPIQKSASAQIESKTEVQPYSNLVTHSMQITHTVEYSIDQEVPFTYTYNSLGWSGTLRFKSMSTDGKVNKVVYEGTIYCSGTCPIPSKKK